jgi:hypothetical protein
VHRLRIIAVLALAVTAIVGVLIITTPTEKDLFVSNSAQLKKLESVSAGRGSLVMQRGNGSCVVYHVKGKIAFTDPSLKITLRRAWAQRIQICPGLHRKVKSSDDVEVISGTGSVYGFTPNGIMMEWYGSFIYVVDQTHPHEYIF